MALDDGGFPKKKKKCLNGFSWSEARWWRQNEATSSILLHSFAFFYWLGINLKGDNLKLNTSSCCIPSGLSLFLLHTHSHSFNNTRYLPIFVLSKMNSHQNLPPLLICIQSRRIFVRASERERVLDCAFHSIQINQIVN